MMAYDNGFVVSIIHNNRPVRETRGNDDRRTCSIPFNSEYKIRLKNGKYRRAYAKVYIDGTPVISGDRKFVLGALQDIDIERFVDDLKEGRKFKFVPLSDSDVQDPTSRENGIIRVEFYPEMERATPLSGIARGLMADTMSWGGAVTNSTTCCAAGATVEGSQSTQEFRQVSGEFEIGGCVVIEIKLVGAMGFDRVGDKRWRVSGCDVYFDGQKLTGIKSATHESNGEVVLRLAREAIL